MSTRFATDKQIAFMRSLLQQIIQSEYKADPDNAAEASLVWEEMFTERIEDPTLTTTGASKVIDDLKARMAILRAKGYVAKAAATAEPGFYIYNNDVYVVVPNKAKTNTYAKRMNLTIGAWEYAPGMVPRLTERLTVEQAAAMGHQHGICVCCGATLTDPKSVEMGIGPVCAKRL